MVALIDHVDESVRLGHAPECREHPGADLPVRGLPRPTRLAQLEVRTAAVIEVAPREPGDGPLMLPLGECASHSELPAERGIHAPLSGVESRLREEPDLGLEPAG